MKDSGKTCYIKVSCYIIGCTFVGKNFPSFGGSTELHSVTPQNTHHHNLKSTDSFLLGYDVSRQSRKPITRPTQRRLQGFFFATHTSFILYCIYDPARLEEGWTVRGSKTGRGEISRTRPHLPWDSSNLLYNKYHVISVGKSAGTSR